MSAYDYDLFVLGAGSGGVRASRVAASHGAKVGICEESRVGGTCVIRGCIPKKLMVYGAHFKDEFENASAYGWNVESVTFDWSTLISNRDKEIDRLNQLYIGLLHDAGVDLFSSHGSIRDAHTVQMNDGTQVRTQNILIATGGVPSLPKIPGIENAVTSNEVFHLRSLPKQIVIVGGGYIACEFASIFNGLGANVVQLYRGSMILRGFDKDIQKFVYQEMIKKGVEIRLNCEVSKIQNSNDHLNVALTNDNTITTDVVLYATGRKPNTANLGLELAGIHLNDRGAVIVDEWSRSSVQSVYAVGDVTDRINLTPVALNEGLCFAETTYGNCPRRMDHINVASAVFSDPTVGSVGMTEDWARKEFGNIDVYLSTFRPLKHTMTGRDEKTMMKIVVARQSQRVVGVHMAGADAAEIIQGIAIAVKMGATKAEFDATIGIHPTAAEEFVTMRKKCSD
tara:strand:- start:1161 stop:2519 length:1359 start_codon:yes stop_codon:yes gene_type:complete